MEKQSYVIDQRPSSGVRSPGSESGAILLSISKLFILPFLLGIMGNNRINSIGLLSRLKVIIPTLELRPVPVWSIVSVQCVRYDLMEIQQKQHPLALGIREAFPKKEVFQRTLERISGYQLKYHFPKEVSPNPI